MPHIYSTNLYTHRNEGSEFKVDLIVLLGNLVIHGYEINRSKNEVDIINSPFTHQITIRKENLQEFCFALNLKTTGRDKIREKLKEKFTGRSCLQLLSDLLKSRGVKFQEYIHDNTGD